MIMTWLIITCAGMDARVRQTLMDTAMEGFTPHSYEATPWLEHRSGSNEAIPTIQIYCRSQRTATRLRKKLRDACAPYEARFPHPYHPGKELVMNPLDSRIMFKYTDEDGNDLPPEHMPARYAG